MAHGIAPIVELGIAMRAFQKPWVVSGGWAIDRFVGDVTRGHEDLEVGIYRCDQGALRKHLAEWTLEKSVERGQGGEWVPWTAGETLALPVHQIRASRVGASPDEFEIFLSESSNTH